MKSPFFRLIFDILIFCLIFLLPWWLSGLAALSGLFLFDGYIEIIVFGFIFDLLFSPSFGIFKYLFMTSGLILFCLEMLFKQKIRR